MGIGSAGFNIGASLNMQTNRGIVNPTMSRPEAPRDRANRKLNLAKTVGDRICSK